MPSFNMYVYGSLDAFMGILNAVAMVFNQSGFMNSVYLLGGLFMIVTVLVQAAGYMASAGQIMKNVAIYATLISVGSIPASLTVQDIYTGQLNKVDNVPLIVAVPAAVSTSAFYGILDKTSTAYQGANASYVSISQGGFMDPLKELLAMRSGINRSNPALADTLRAYIVNCWSNAQAPGNVEELMKNKSGLEYLLTNGSVPAWTVNYINAVNKIDGDSVVCRDAADKIWTEAQAYLYRDQGLAPSLVEQVIRNKPGIGPRAGGNNPNLTATQLIDSANATLRALSVSGQTTQEQMLNLLTLNLVGDTFGCIQNSGGAPTEITNCATHTIAMTQGVEQWKADAASNASFFQGIMLPASMFLQMLAIALFPIMFIVAVLSIGKAIQLMTGYIVLLVWSSSWAPVAAAIQWVMQMILNGDMAKYKSGITYANATQFYNTLSTDLAIGADLLAATPLIALAVIMGNAMAMAGLAGRWSSDRVNEKMASPDLQTPGAVSAVGSRQTVEPGVGSSYATGESLAKLDVNSAISEGIASQRQSALRAAENWSKTHEFGSEQAKGLSTSLRESMSATDSVMKKFDKSQGFTQEDRAQFQSTLSAGAGTGSLLPVQLNAQIQNSAMSAEGKTKAMQWVESNSSDLKMASEKARAVDESFRSFEKMSQSHGYQDGIELAKSYQESSSLARGLGVSQSVTSAQFGKFYQDASDAGRMQYDQLRGIAAKEFMPGGALQGRNKSYSGMNMGSDFGQIEALLKSSDSRHVALGGAMVGALAGTNVSSNYGQYSSIPTPGSGPSGTIAAPAGFGGMTDPSQKVRGTVTDVPQNISSGQAQIDGTTATPPPIRGAAELGGKVMDAAKSLTENAAKSYAPNQSRGGGAIADGYSGPGSSSGDPRPPEAPSRIGPTALTGSLDRVQRTEQATVGDAPQNIQSVRGQNDTWPPQSPARSTASEPRDSHPEAPTQTKGIAGANLTVGHTPLSEPLGLGSEKIRSHSPSTPGGAATPPNPDSALPVSDDATHPAAPSNPRHNLNAPRTKEK